MPDIHSTYLEDPRLNAQPHFGESLGEFIGAEVTRFRDAVGAPAQWQVDHADALERLADHIPEVDEIRDRRIAIINFANAAFATIRRQAIRNDGRNVGSDDIGVIGGHFDKPSPLQVAILGSLGDPLHPAPSPDQTLTDLAAAAVKDLHDITGKQAAREQEKSSGLDQENGRLVAELEQARAAISELENRNATEDALRAENAELLKMNDVLQKAAAQEPKKPSRRLIETGIYRTPNGALRVAEPDGKGGTTYAEAETLEEARELRDEIESQKAELQSSSSGEEV